jgi:N-acetylglucosamine kinase-like BadF-type ATPase
MQFSLGFDGGGTKTDCAVIDATGKVVSEGRGGPCNPLRSSYEIAFQSLRQSSAEAIRNGNVKKHKITAVCAGIAGAGRRNVARKLLVFLDQEFPGAAVHVTTDAEIALEAGAGAAPGVVLIAGTGSIAYGRNAAGEIARAGGYGPWIGDAGSAFDIGLCAVIAVARSRDFLAPVTILAETIPEALKCPDWDELLERIMKEPDQVFPKVFPLVVEAADAGDSTAHEILFSSAVGLGNLAMSVVRRLGMQRTEFRLVKCGGVFGKITSLDKILDPILSSGAEKAVIARLELSPAVGAARFAARLVSSQEQTGSHG